MPSTGTSHRTRTLLRPVRAVLKPLATKSAYSPIETIVLFFVIGTLAYFHVLSAIKHSAFLAPPVPPTLRPAYARLVDGTWAVPRDVPWSDVTLELQQFVFSLAPASAHKAKMHAHDSSVADSEQLYQSVNSFTENLARIASGPSDVNFSTICYHPSLLTNKSPSPSKAHRPVTRHKVNYSHPTPSTSTPVECFNVTASSGRSTTLSLAFLAGTREDFVSALSRQSKTASDSLGVKFTIENRQTETIGQMKSSKWVARAAGVLVMRFWDLAKKAPTPDILLILAGYIVMHLTFLRLVLRSRSLGSTFWLPTAIVSSSVLALLVSLPIAMYLHIPIDPVALSEAFPFLVCTVGFDKPLRLARAVFSHPHLLSSSSSTSNQMKPAAYILLEALSEVCNPILRDYALEIAVLLVGAQSGVGGLREVCALAATLLVVDCFMMTTFLVSILEVMVEVQRIQSVREMSNTSSTSSSTSRNVPSSSSIPMRKLSSTLLGVKGSMLSGNGYERGREENPVARLKLLLIVSFLTLHILNLCTPLTPPRYNTHPPIQSRKVDIGDSSILPVLTLLAESADPGLDLIVKVLPPIYIRILPSTSYGGASEMLENFMSSWTRLVGDPVLSKWIVLVLAVSVSLNGYLLKGIAAGLARHGGAVFRWDQSEAEKQVVISGSTTVTPANGTTAMTAFPNGSATTETIILNGLAPRRASFTLESLDARLRRPRRLAPSPPSDDEREEDEETEGEEEPRSLEELVHIFEHGPKPQSVALALLSDEEVVLLAQNGKIAVYALEKVLGNLERAVKIRRVLISRASKTKTLETSAVPMKDYDYSRVMGACCENVVGYIPIPLGIAGPLKVDGELYPIPMATAEGTLVASTSRGCKALNAGGGVTTVLTQDCMTRGPAIDFPSIVVAARAKMWIDSEAGYAEIRTAFESTSRFAKLQRLKTALAGRTLFVRFATSTGDAMGMNMISKGTEKALEVLRKRYPEMVVLALSGNYCTDKKPAAINWIEGRGKSVVAEAVVPGHVVKTVLKTTVEALCTLNMKKNLVGSAMAGSIGGFNAHAANILTAVFLASGQDPAQNVESSNCMTLMEPTNNGEDLLMTVSMPCIEVGTVGGGTVLAPQQAVLEMLGVKGAHPTSPGQNAQRLARVIAAAVMAGELSLLSALAAGHLVRAHLAHNRSAMNTPAATPSTTRPPTPGPSSSSSLSLAVPPSKLLRSTWASGLPSPSSSNASADR